MIWIFKKKRKSTLDVDKEQGRAEVARLEMDAMHKRLEDAVNGLLNPRKKKENG